jgi:hypothetical protein
VCVVSAILLPFWGLKLLLSVSGALFLFAVVLEVDCCGGGDGRLCKIAAVAQDLLCFLPFWKRRSSLRKNVGGRF